MKMVENNRVSKAQDRVLSETCMEYVTDVYAAPDFVQVDGKAGGDSVCYRVYNDGTIVER